MRINNAKVIFEREEANNNDYITLLKIVESKLDYKEIC